MYLVFKLKKHSSTLFYQHNIGLGKRIQKLISGRGSAMFIPHFRVIQMLSSPYKKNHVIALDEHKETWLSGRTAL